MMPSESSESPTTACLINNVLDPPFNSETVCLNFEEDEILTFQDFEDGQRRGWSNAFVDQTYSNGENFTRFMGKFDQSMDFPFKTWTFDTFEVRKFYVHFDFYEIDHWDGDSPYKGGIDRFLLGVDGDDGGEIIDFGWFQRDYAENATIAITNNTIGVTPRGVRYWMYGPTPVSHIGFGASNDQIHKVLVEVPRLYFETNKSVTITIRWDLVSKYLDIERR